MTVIDILNVYISCLVMKVQREIIVFIIKSITFFNKGITLNSHHVLKNLKL